MTSPVPLQSTRQRPPRIGFVTPGWPRREFANGVVTAVEALLPYLDEAGIESVVLPVEYRSGAGHDRVVELPPAATPRGRERLEQALEWRFFPGRARAAFGADRVVRSLVRLAEDEQVDLIEMEESFGRAAPVEARCKVPVVVFLHGPWFLHGALVDSARGLEFRQRVRAEGLGIRSAHGLLAPAQDVLARTRNYYQLGLPRAEVVPYAMPLRPEGERWRLAGCAKNEILFVGRFDRHKGGDILIDAFARVLTARPDSRLVFAGPDRGLVDDQGRRWQLAEYAASRIPGALDSGQLELLGQQDPSRIDELRRRALVTVSCSRYENLSLAAFEAMAMGCPLVVADRGGLPEHVRDGETGRVFRAGDAGSLAETLLTLLGDPEAAARMGANAARHVLAQLDPLAVARARADFYRRVIAAHRASQACGA